MIPAQELTLQPICILLSQMLFFIVACWKKAGLWILWTNTKKSEELHGNNRTSGENAKKTISEYAAEKNCKQETAAEYLNAAKGIRSRQSFYVPDKMKTARKPAKMSVETITGTMPKSSGMVSKPKPFKKPSMLLTIENKRYWKNATLSVCAAAE